MVARPKNPAVGHSSLGDGRFGADHRFLDDDGALSILASSMTDVSALGRVGDHQRVQGLVNLFCGLRCRREDCAYQ